MNGRRPWERGRWAALVALGAAGAIVDRGANDPNAADVTDALSPSTAAANVLFQFAEGGASSFETSAPNALATPKDHGTHLRVEAHFDAARARCDVFADGELAGSASAPATFVATSASMTIGVDDASFADGGSWRGRVDDGVVDVAR